MNVNFVTELTTNTNLCRITKYLIIQTLIKYFSIKYIHSMNFVENASLEQLIIDVKGFFVRNAKSLAENTKSFMNLRDSNTVQNALISIKDSNMLMNITKEYTSLTESERFSGMWKAIGLISSLRRTSNNELAELNFNIEELQNEYFEPMTTKRIEEKDKDNNITGYHYDPDSLRFIIFDTIDDLQKAEHEAAAADIVVEKLKKEIAALEDDFEEIVKEADSVFSELMKKKEELRKRLNNPKYDKEVKDLNELAKILFG